MSGAVAELCPRGRGLRTSSTGDRGRAATGPWPRPLVATEMAAEVDAVVVRRTAGKVMMRIVYQFVCHFVQGPAANGE